MKVIKYSNELEVRDKIEDYLCDCFEKNGEVYYVVSVLYKEDYCEKEVTIFDAKEPLYYILDYYKRFIMEDRGCEYELYQLLEVNENELAEVLLITWDKDAGFWLRER